MTRARAALLIIATTIAIATPAAATPTPVPDQTAEASKAMAQIATYVTSLEVHQIEQAVDALGQQVSAYVAGLEADQAAAAARQRSVPVPARPPSSSAGTGSTGACGGATNGADRYIARESGGNPGIYNTGGSGAWGCYQIMPATWAASCSDLGQHGTASAQAQAACASRLPLSAWNG